MRPWAAVWSVLPTAGVVADRCLADASKDQQLERESWGIIFASAAACCVLSQYVTCPFPFLQATFYVCCVYY
jgi:hypothetical protein